MEWSDMILPRFWEWWATWEREWRWFPRWQGHRTTPKRKQSKNQIKQKKKKRKGPKSRLLHARPPRCALVDCGLLGPPPVPIFWYIGRFDLEKNKEKTFEMERRHLEVELGQEHFCPPAERLRRGNFPPGGGNHHHHHHQQLSHLREGYLHQHIHNTNSYQTLVHLLCSIFVSKL